MCTAVIGETWLGIKPTLDQSQGRYSTTTELVLYLYRVISSAWVHYVLPTEGWNFWKHFFLFLVDDVDDGCQDTLLPDDFVSLQTQYTSIRWQREAVFHCSIFHLSSDSLTHTELVLSPPGVQQGPVGRAPTYLVPHCRQNETSQSLCCSDAPSIGCLCVTCQLSLYNMQQSYNSNPFQAFLSEIWRSNLTCYKLGCSQLIDYRFIVN